MTSQAESKKETFYYKCFAPDVCCIISHHKLARECFNCKSYYQDNNRPYQVKCGHSVCQRCKDAHATKPLLCCKCVLVLPNSKNAIRNVYLWEQLVRLSGEEQLMAFIENRERSAASDPQIILAEAVLEKVCQILHMKKFLRDLVEYFKGYTKYTNVVDAYEKMIEEFAEEQTQYRLPEALRRLSDKFEKIEDTLRTVSHFDEQCRKVNEMKTLFFNVFKKVEIVYSAKAVMSLLDEGYRIFSLMERGEEEEVTAELSNGEVGLHFHSCKPEDSSIAKLYFWYQDFQKEVDPPVYIFLHLEATIEKKKIRRRVYVEIMDNLCQRRLLDFFIGIPENFKGVSFTYGKRMLTGNLPDKKNLVSDYPVVVDRIGLVSLHSMGDSAKLIISMGLQPQEAPLSNCIGRVSSGFPFLAKSNGCQLVDHGVCYGKLRD